MLHRAIAVALLAGAMLPATAAEPTLIEFTQTPCQFVEAENGVDHGFRSSAKADCARVNADSGAKRLAASQVLKLPPGKYVFRVTNKNVPYELGFWLRGDGVLNRARLPSISGGGLHSGKTRDYAIELPPGEYVYSCPLNPTPDYRIIVEG